MLSPKKIVPWVTEIVKGMRLSRGKTLAAIVQGALAMNGMGVLSLGRAMTTATSAKHNIKRVNDFLGNEAVEVEAVARGLFEAFAPSHGLALVLVDWTDMPNAKMLVFALPRSGRALPFLGLSVPKQAGEGMIRQAEERGLEMLARVVGERPDVALVTVADRGFGNKRWLTDLRTRGWHFVQRLSRNLMVDVEEHIGTLKELSVRRGSKPKDRGWGVFGQDEEIEGRLITVFDKEAKEPWYLVTDLEEVCAAEVVGIYRRRMWIEALFRDGKNRDWGLGMNAVKLKDYRRYERLFVIFALTYIILSAFGAAAEAKGFDRGLKANTRPCRVINLIRQGFAFLRDRRCTLRSAVASLTLLET